MKKKSDINIIVQKSCIHLLSCREAIEGIEYVAEIKGYDPVFHYLSSAEISLSDLNGMAAASPSCSAAGQPAAEGAPAADEDDNTGSGNQSRMKILVLGFTDIWVKVCAERLTVEGAHVILVNASSPFASRDVSCVNQDRKSAIIKGIEYLAGAGRTHTALLGVNSLAFADLQKKEAFLLYKGSHYSAGESHLNMDGEGRTGADEDVFESKGSIDECCRAFLNKFLFLKACGKAYDSVICVNDMIAVLLIKRAAEAGVRVPEDLYVIGYGNSAVGRHTKPQLTSLDLDYRKAGENAVIIFQMLDMMSDISGLNTTIESKVNVRGSTAFYMPAAGMKGTVGRISPTDRLQFINDPDVVEIFKIENLLNHCDELDLAIIRGILAGKSKETVAESIPIGISTFRYRLKKLFQAAELDNKDELRLLLGKYRIDMGG